MNILLLGGGGREHALAWGLRRSRQGKNLWCAPGNAGVESLATCVSLDARDEKAVLDFIGEKKIDLTVVGPEAPLVDGLADALRSAGRAVFGPGRAAARLEGSKVFSKNFMKSYGIPTAEFKTFSFSDEALSFVRSGAWRESFRVVKAGGLAAGKGVTVCKDRDEVLAALDEAMVKKAFGSAGDQVVLEEALSGEELSVIALCDGETLLPLVSSQDHKRVFDDDRGPNTGGMGAYAPVSHVPEKTWEDIRNKVFKPFLDGLRGEGLDYRGVIYFGLMLTPDGPEVLEFNVRFGDPETQVIIPLVENDWADLFQACADNRLKDVVLRRREGAAVAVVMASGGYPGPFQKGKEITGLEKWAGVDDVIVFHAGTARSDGKVLTAGGRVLAVTGLGATLDVARRRAYEAAETIHFEGAHFRKDIGARALAAKR